MFEKTKLSLTSTGIDPFKPEKKGYGLTQLSGGLPKLSSKILLSLCLGTRERGQEIG